MTLRSLFIREHDGSACSGGVCRHDAKCTSNCAGHPRNHNYECDDPAPDSWAVVLAVVGWACLAIAAAFAAFAFAAFSDWTPAIWPRLVVALS
jgi:hypothetical protein